MNMHLRIKAPRLGLFRHIPPIILLSSITIFTTYTWGRYVLFAAMVLIFLSDSCAYHLKFRHKIKGLFLNALVLIFYAFASSLWAAEPSGATTNGKTLFEILLMLVILYNHYISEEDGVRFFLLDIKIASFLIVIYTIIVYGVDNLMLLAKLERRMSKSFANVNTIGMLAAIGVLIQLDEMLVARKVKALGVFCLPSIYLIALTQSRKAISMLLLGFCLILWFRKVYSKNMKKTVPRLLFATVMVVILLIQVIQLPIFSGVMGRMEGLLNGIKGTGVADHSTNERNEMVRIGLEQFQKTPLFGIGMGNSYVLTRRYLGYDTYLHNNFVELLACGGIVGFSIYYFMYAYLFLNYWNLRAYKNQEFSICLTIMIVMLVMDWGRVSYYAKTQWVYLLLYYIELEQLKRNKEKSAGALETEDAN